MDMEEVLNQRLELLFHGGAISERIVKCSKTIVKLLVAEMPEADCDKVVMFLTHFAMAGQRILDGKKEKPLDSQILESVMQEAVYRKALEFLTAVLSLTDWEFSNTEKELLTVHLCNCFRRAQ